MSLSVGIITFNEEKIISSTLAAVKEIADEVIIVDSHSTDNTVSIAKQFGAEVYEEDWKGFGPQKNSALDKCKGDWILFLDADEIVSPELLENIKKIINGNCSFSVYKISMEPVCFGKHIKHCWGNDSHIRLWKKGTVRYNNRFVHEKMLTDKKVGRIREKIYHYTYPTLHDYFEKLNKYTILSAEEYYEKGKTAGGIKIILRPFYTFFKMYILRRGFLDGLEGFVICFLNAVYVMAKYFKLREIYKNNTYKEKL
ncbi:MAG: glycosyltransferase family 2 protein [Victivallales bacterium]|nr:glycosyltransferase family 2 protein [Victivallales bacterium]